MFFFSSKLTPTRKLDGNGVSTAKERHKTCAEKRRVGLCAPVSVLTSSHHYEKGWREGRGAKGEWEGVM